MNQQKITNPALFSIFENQAKIVGDFCRELPWENKTFYGIWLSQMHCFLKHATPMLSLAASKLRNEDYFFHAYMVRHNLEELGHEFLCEKDLQRLGFSATSFPEFIETAQLYQSQYFFMNEEDPLALLGNIYYLEVLSLVAGPYVVEKLVMAHGAENCKLLLEHVSGDKAHVDDVSHVIARVPESRLPIVLRSFEISHECYLRMLHSCRDLYLKIEGPQAAVAVEHMDLF